MNLNYKHLHYFWVVAQEGSITRAAERLDVAVQTISGQLGLLEKQVGRALFNSQGRGLVLSDAGRVALGSTASHKPRGVAGDRLELLAVFEPGDADRADSAGERSEPTRPRAMNSSGRGARCRTGPLTVRPAVPARKRPRGCSPLR